MSLNDKIKKIKCLILDVDGVLTDGKITYTSQNEEIKSFHVHDGLGLKLLQKTGVKIAIITARTSSIVAKRMQELGIEHVFQQAKNKLECFEKLKSKLQLNDDEMAFVGDDLPDFALLKRVGFSASVADAQEIILSQVNYVTKKNGGHGAVREICNLIIHIQGNENTAHESFLR